jgi:hypothetical protein
MDTFGEKQGMILQAVKEYLQKYNYVDTIRTLEVRKK